MNIQFPFVNLWIGGLASGIGLPHLGHAGAASET